jgi:hypothetical protein
MLSPRRWWLVLVVACSLTAQSPTFVVDAADGPGAQFTSIQAAVLAVPDGSTLLVRPGLYSAIDIDGKAITILAEDGTIVSATLGVPGPFLVVRNLLPNQAVTVRGVEHLQTWAAPSTTRLVLDNNAGPVTIDGVGKHLEVLNPWLSGNIVSVHHCQQVTLRRWVIAGGVGDAACGVVDSSVVFEQCRIYGMAALTYPEAPLWHAEPGLDLLDAEVQLVQTSVLGGNGMDMSGTILLGAPAVEMTTSSLRACGAIHNGTGTSNVILGGNVASGSLSGGRAPAIIGTGVARVEPSILLDGPPFGVALTRPTMPSLLLDSALPGGVITATRYGDPGLACAIAISLRGPTLVIPGVADPIWCDAPSLSIVAAGVTPAVGDFTATLSIPNLSSLRGFAFVGQVAEFDATGALAVSNPSPGFVR